ncbi:hypothetical protein SEA_RIZWANA_45 [Arthrobacter phage Rizwana]|nr:hypothetical protein SEA_RIZWANA_45 [Arthrobacter phage Rizwana]
MTWLAPEQMDMVYTIRQDFAKAMQQVEEAPSILTINGFAEVTERRARAMRMLTRETEVTPRQLAAMFRCSKQVVRKALAEVES